MRWEDVVKKNVEELEGGSDWKARAADREGWKDRCMTSHPPRGHKHPKKKKCIVMVKIPRWEWGAAHQL